MKVQVAQLETTLKADLNDKKMLSDALATERENLAKMEADFQDLQSKYFALKENLEGHGEKLRFFAHENSVDAEDLEQALLQLKQRPLSATGAQNQPSSQNPRSGGSQCKISTDIPQVLFFVKTCRFL